MLHPYAMNMTAADFRAWRARRRLNQAAAAKAIGFSRRFIQAIESGEDELPLKLALAVEGYEARLVA